MYHVKYYWLLRLREQGAHSLASIEKRDNTTTTTTYDWFTA